MNDGDTRTAERRAGGFRRRALLAAAAATAAVVVAAPGPASAQAPAAVLSPDGRTATDGQRSLTVSQVAGLHPDGQTITVSGAGYDESKGIYVALCAIPPRDHTPSPCGGGVDREGQAGASQWISSNPPDYGVGLARPYGPGGSFATSFSVQAVLSPGVDCRIVACAVVTRNDHTRAADRTQDILVPVTFAAAADAGGGSAGAGVPGGAPPPTAPPDAAIPVETLPPSTTTTTVGPPAATVRSDGREVTDGARTLAASATTDLDPTGAVIVVRGSGFDTGAGVYVALCAVGADGVPPGPCSGGSEGASAWITDTPPDYAADLARPYGAGGSFETTLTVGAVIDAATDCRRVACAVTTRPDDTDPLDRSQELVLPVTFAAEAPTTTTAFDREGDRDGDGETAAAVVVDDEPGGGTALPWALAAIVVTGAAAGTALAWHRRRAHGAPTPG